jgi:hypothetical protein
MAAIKALSPEKKAKIRNKMLESGSEILNKKSLTQEDFEKIDMILTVKSHLDPDRGLNKLNRKVASIERRMKK